MASGVHLDTNYLILLASGTDLAVRAQVECWVRQAVPLHASAMAWAEFCCGPADAAMIAAVEALLDGVAPLDHEVATLAATLFNRTGRRSRSLADCLIAATAIRSGASLATCNREDFQPFVKHRLCLAEAP